MNRLMNRKQSLPLPDYDNAKEMANQFSDFFQGKVPKFRKGFSDDIDSAYDYHGYTINTHSPQALNVFCEVNELAFKHIITKSATKSCELDPLPTTLLINNLDIFLPVITKIVNLSLKESNLPEVLKWAIIRPLLKKPDF